MTEEIVKKIIKDEKKEDKIKKNEEEKKAKRWDEYKEMIKLLEESKKVKRIIVIEMTDRKVCDNPSCCPKKMTVTDWLEKTKMQYCECGASRYCSKECLEINKDHHSDCKEKKLMRDDEIVKKINDAVEIVKKSVIRKDSQIDVSLFDKDKSLEEALTPMDPDNIDHLILKQRYPKNVIVYIDYPTSGSRVRFWKKCIIFPEQS